MNGSDRKNHIFPLFETHSNPSARPTDRGQENPLVKSRKKGHFLLGTRGRRTKSKDDFISFHHPQIPERNIIIVQYEFFLGFGYSWLGEDGPQGTDASDRTDDGKCFKNHENKKKLLYLFELSIFCLFSYIFHLYNSF